MYAKAAKKLSVNTLNKKRRASLCPPFIINLISLEQAYVKPSQ